MNYNEIYAEFIQNMLGDDIIQCIAENDDIGLDLSDKITNAVNYCVDNDAIYDNVEQFVQRDDKENIIAYYGIEHCLNKYKYIGMTKLCMDVLSDELSPDTIRAYVRDKIRHRACSSFLGADLMDLKSNMCSVYDCENCPAKINGICMVRKLYDNITDE